MTNPDIAQIPLSQDLALLGKFWWKRLPSGPFLNKQELILNIVALYLTTGRSGGVIAAFFHDTTFTLYLAKSGPLIPEDATMATSFLSSLKHATGFENFVPFLSRNSAANVEKRVRKLRESFADFLPAMVKVVLEHEKEKRAIENLQTLLGSPFTFNDTPEAHETFKRIVDASESLLKLYSFLRRAFASKYGNEYLIRLERHLIKIVQYLDVKHLIQFVKRIDSEVTIFWIQDAKQRQLSLNSLTEALAARRLDPLLAQETQEYSSDEVDEIRDLMTLVLELVEPDLEVTLFVHPEIRLITYLTDVADVQSQYPQGSTLYIGSGQRVCGCCEQWINAFNESLSVQWVTTFTNDKMRCDWMIMDPDDTQHIQAAVRQANDAVLERVESGINNALLERLDLAIEQLF